jgi:hypothetical protein
MWRQERDPRNYVWSTPAELNEALERDEDDY